MNIIDRLKNVARDNVCRKNTAYDVYGHDNRIEDELYFKAAVEIERLEKDNTKLREVAHSLLLTLSVVENAGTVSMTVNAMVHGEIVKAKEAGI